MHENILWVEPYEFISIEALEITKSVNEHGKAYVKGIIHHTKKEQYLHSLQAKKWIKIFGQNEEKVISILFCGSLVRAEIEEEISGIRLSIELISGTHEMDTDSPYRVFQKKHYSMDEVIIEIGKRYSDYTFSINDDLHQLEGLRLQYGETDWQFLQRLLGEQNGFIVPNCYREGIHFQIGFKNRKPITMDETEFSYVTEGESWEYEVKSREIYNLGETVNFNSRIMCIARIHTVYQKAECIHEYFLMPEQKLGLKKRFNEKIAGCSLYGIVTAIEKDKVQVDFTDTMNTAESKHENTKIWFLFSTVYSTPAGAGWYCMPEEGDRVRVYFPTEQEEDAYVISAVHTKNAPNRQNPDYKSIKNKYGKEIILTPDKIAITNNKGMTIELDDETGINMKSNKDIHFIAQEQILVSSSQESIMLAGKESVAINQSGTSILVDKNILFHGSEFRIQ